MSKLRIKTIEDFQNEGTSPSFPRNIKTLRKSLIKGKFIKI